MTVLPRAARLLLGAAVVLPLGLAAVALPLGSASAADAPVPLGTAEAFAVLAGSTVTSTGPSVVTGELGVSPGTSITGFPPGLVLGGTRHSADGVAGTAQADVTTAFTNAAARPSSATVGELAGSTLVAGVYADATVTLRLNGTLTLDGQGDPDSVFVFQAGSTFVTGSGSKVLLIGGAQACRVYFQVGSSATLGTDSVLAGTVLAEASITAQTRSAVDGRLLARTGAVTLDTTRVTAPTCAAPAASPSPTAAAVSPAASPASSPAASTQAASSPAASSPASPAASVTPAVSPDATATPTVSATPAASPAAPALPAASASP
ncbi:MAG: hypothetical protein JWO60_1224, partial [Frankiales bacterium]|nr:hypothetical protein [Frankiales bacterium]